MERCREARIETGANIIVTTRNTGEIAELGLLVRSLGGERFVPTYPFCWWVGPEHANLQPEPEDLVGLLPEGLDVNWGYRDFWSDPEAFTESALVGRAIESGDEEQASGSTKRRLHLWVWPNRDLLVNDSRPVPTQRLANLNTDPPQKIYEALVNLEWPPDPPSEAEMARRYGNPKGRKVFYGTPDYYNGLGTVRQKWLEAWRVDQGITWLPFPW